MPKSLLMIVCVACGLVAAFLPSQGIQGLEPLIYTGDIIVTDRSGVAENVRRLIDLNLDGDFDDTGEIVVFYSGLTGAWPLGDPSGIAAGKDGVLYVGDATSDVVLALLDLNGDGDAMDAGEARVWFNGNPGGNASGIVMSSAQDLVVDAAGTVWVANANAASGGNDAILRLADAGGTYGANDPGEAIEYATFPGGSALPTDLAIGAGGFIYFLDSGNGMSIPRGIHRLHDDVIPNGNCNDPGEVSTFWTAPAGSTALFALAVDIAGWFYAADQAGDTIRALRDLNGDYVITPNGPEDALFWTSPSSQVWGLSASLDGGLYATESQAPARILRLQDSTVLNGTALDPGETVEVYSSAVSPSTIGDPFAIAHLRIPTLAIQGAPSISTPFPIRVTSTVGHFVSVWLSTGTAAGQPLPPYGVLALVLAPPELYFEVFSGIVPAGGVFTWMAPAVNDPLLVGFYVFLQGYGGFPSRLQFTNPLEVTFLP